MCENEAILDVSSQVAANIYNFYLTFHTQWTKKMAADAPEVFHRERKRVVLKPKPHRMREKRSTRRKHQPFSVPPIQNPNRPGLYHRLCMMSYAEYNEAVSNWYSSLSYMLGCVRPRWESASYESDSNDPGLNDAAKKFVCGRSGYTNERRP